MFPVNCEDEGSTTENGDCNTSHTAGWNYWYGDVRAYKCYDKYNNINCDWSGGHCCNSYDESFISVLNDTSYCTSCLCLDPDKTTIPGTLGKNKFQLLWTRI